MSEIGTLDWIKEKLEKGEIGVASYQLLDEHIDFLETNINRVKSAKKHSCTKVLITAWNEKQLGRIGMTFLSEDEVKAFDELLDKYGTFELKSKD